MAEETWQERLIRIHNVELEAWWERQVRDDTDNEGER